MIQFFSVRHLLLYVSRTAISLRVPYNTIATHTYKTYPNISYYNQTVVGFVVIIKKKKKNELSLHPVYYCIISLFFLSSFHKNIDRAFVFLPSEFQRDDLPTNWIKKCGRHHSFPEKNPFYF